MLTTDMYRSILATQGHTVGEARKKHADEIMEMTWNNDIQSKICYIYDYDHDDKPSVCTNITYENTTKTKIDAKFIVTQYNTLSKDQVEYHLMFKPSQKLSFDMHDELYYYETKYKQRYHAEFPIGMYIDIPNDRGEYTKWLICSKDYGNQFIKYSILPCNYYLHWIDNYGNKRTKKRMWCVAKSQNSYNSGLWTDYLTTSVQNQNIVWLPMCGYTENIYYTYINGDYKNQRLIISAPIEQPITWKISKVDNYQPFGIQKITVAQDRFNPYTDYVNLETGEMYADYYSSNVIPKESISSTDVMCDIKINSSNIKVGGSYKLLTAIFYDKDRNDITSNVSDIQWCFEIDSNALNDDLLSTLSTNNNNQIKIKFANDRAYLTKLINIKCTGMYNNEEIKGYSTLEITAI